EARRMADGSLLAFEKIYPLDAAYDTLAEAPDDVRANKRYKDVGDFSIAGLAERLTQDFGARSLDIVVHSLANGPEVKKPLLETSRAGYLTAVSVSAYSLVSLVARLGPLLRPRGSFLSLTYLASERVVPGYGGGVSSASPARPDRVLRRTYRERRLLGQGVPRDGDRGHRRRAIVSACRRCNTQLVPTAQRFARCATNLPKLPRRSARSPSGTCPASHT